MNRQLQKTLPSISAAEAAARMETTYLDGMEYLAWPETFGSTAGPWPGIGGSAMTTFTMEAWLSTETGTVLIFCNGRVVRLMDGRHSEVGRPAMTDPLKALEQKWRDNLSGSRAAYVECADELAATVAGMRGRTCETCRHDTMAYRKCERHVVRPPYLLSYSHNHTPFGCVLHEPTPPEPVKGDEK